MESTRSSLLTVYIRSKNDTAEHDSLKMRRSSFLERTQVSVRLRGKSGYLSELLGKNNQS